MRGVESADFSSLPEAPTLSTPSSWDAILGNRSELLLHVQSYFSTVHYYGFLTFIHEPSFYQLLDKGAAPRELTLMLVVCSLHFANGTPAALSRACTVYSEVFKTIQDNVFQRNDAVHLMTLLLARVYEAARGNFVASWTMCGLIVRTMQFLSLHTFDETYNTQAPTVRHNPLLKPEALRRVAWAVFYLDTLADTGQHGVHLVTDTAFRIQLPCDEASFVRGIEVETARLHDLRCSVPNPLTALSPNGEGPSHVGISGHLMRTAAMRRRVLHFDSLIQHSTDSSAKILADLADFEQHLRKVISDLPDDLAYSDHNLFVQARRLPAFLFLHLLRHNCFLMLAQARLNVCSRDPSLKDFALSVCRERIRHAIPVSRIVADIIRLGVNCSPAVGVQAYTSLEILLYDPLLLSEIDSSVQPRELRFTGALRTLLECIRQQGRRDERNRLMHLEACSRLVGCSFEDLLTPSDWEKCKKQVVPYLAPYLSLQDRERRSPRQDSTRFDFSPLPFHRQRTGRTGYAMLDSTVRSFAPSRAVSPEAEPIDAGAIALSGVTPLGPTSSRLDNKGSNMLSGKDDVLFSGLMGAVSNTSTGQMTASGDPWPGAGAQLDVQSEIGVAASNTEHVAADVDWVGWWNSFGGLGTVEQDPLDWLREQ